MQDDDRTKLGLEAAERGIEQLAIGHCRGRVSDDWRMDRRQLDLGRTATSLAQRIDTRTHDKPPQPGFEPVWVAQTGQVPPGPDETFLDRVSRELVIPEDQAGRRIQ